MKKLLLLIIAVLLLAVVYMLGTFKARTTITIPEDRSSQGSDAALAWQELGVSMQAIGAKVSAAATNPLDRAEGMDMLADLMSLALEMKYSKGDPAAPQLTDWMSGHRKAMGDSPDAIYHTAEILPQYSYEISGTRNDAEYLGVMVYGRQVNGWNKAGANLSGAGITYDEQGRFRILISRTRPSDSTANWLAMDGKSHTVMIRQYFHDRPSKTPAILSIRNIDPPAHTPDTDVQIAARLRAANTFFVEAASGVIALNDMLSSAPNNPDPPRTYNPDFGGIFYPTDDNQYSGTWLQIEKDQALIVEGPAPDVDYWSVSLQNRWLQSLDYKHRNVSLTNHEITVKNGRYKIIIAHQDPNTGDDWLDMSGHTTGLLGIRYQLAGNVERPDIRLVRFDELGE